MGELIGLLVQIGIAVFLIALGFFVGKVRERRHFRSLLEREEQYGHIVVTNLKRVPAGVSPRGAFLCMGSVVIASDYFKTFGAALKNLIGGRLRTFETLLERGRREAVLRMLAEADHQGATLVLNVRLETSAIARGGRKGNAVGAVEVLAYGTAVTGA